MIICMIINFKGAFHVLTLVLMWIALALTLISMADYIAKNIKVLTQGGL